ncbi:MAG: hypothetical protein K0R80_2156 [Clostridia bacterium]|nr:hypothetical protein [Clostridia bacterium]
MKKTLIILIPLFILVTLAISNPSKVEYVEWANKQIIGENDNLINKLGSAIASPIINEATTFDNYLLFSVYKTVNIDGSVYKTLGIYRSFILMSKSEGYINLNYNNNSSNQITSSNQSININTLIESAGTEVNNLIDSANKAINDALTFQPTQPMTDSSDELDIGGTIIEGTVYNTYANGRYGFTIDYPNQFGIGIPPQNGDGLEFISRDGKAGLVASGRNNVMDENAKDMYEAEVASINNISYKFQKDNWFVLSWIDNKTVYYARVIVGEGSINTFMFSCPEEQLDQYYDIIEHISKSFKKGNIEIAN